MQEDYRLFALVVETGSLSGAGRILRVSPAVVSRRLARLEARLGAQLIHRTTRRLAMTDVGQVFYEEVAGILTACAAAEARVLQRAKAPVGRLRVAAPTSFGRMHIAPHLGAFLDANPLVEVELVLNDEFANLVEDRFDMAIRISQPPDGALVSRLLAPNVRILCASPDYLKRQGEPPDIAALNLHQLLASTNRSTWRLEGPDGIRIVQAASPVRTNSTEVVRELALAARGIALRSLWDVSRELEDGLLRRVLPDWQGATDVGIYAVRPRTELLSPSVKAFIEYLGNLYAPPAPWEPPARDL
jgi:DNA-binding transcriptional LysR family regulator